MDGLFPEISTFFSGLFSVIKTFSIFDALDILLVAFLLYKAIILLRETVAVQLLKGILLLILAYLVATVLQLKIVSWLLVNVFQIGLIAIVIVFQPEIRRALESMGRSSVVSLLGFHADNSEEINQRTAAGIEAITGAAVSLSSSKTGALMVIERETKLGEIIKTGTVIDSQLSVELIGNIFFPNTPLHDGAMVIRGDRMHAAGCFLPLSQNNKISKQLGTRHRAALGISEVSDAIVVVVSEETGKISVAKGGVLTRDYNRDMLRRYLTQELITETQKDNTQPVWDLRGIFKKRKKNDSSDGSRK